MFVQDKTSTNLLSHYYTPPVQKFIKTIKGIAQQRVNQINGPSEHHWKEIVGPYRPIEHSILIKSKIVRGSNDKILLAIKSY